MALWETLQPLLPDHEVLIKWPNDLLVDRKKVAGLLCENQWRGADLHAVVAGVGLNVNETDFPEELSPKATSLALATGQTFDQKPLLNALLSHIEARYLQLRSGRTEAMDRTYLAQLYGYQEVVDFLIDGEPVKRHLVGVDHQGRLALEKAGRLEYFHNKSLEFVL